MIDDRNGEAVAYRLRVELAIFGSDQDFLEINTLLGVDAKHYARKGQGVAGRPVARQNVWAYWGELPPENSNIVEQWMPIKDLIACRQDQIVELGKYAKVRVAVVVHAFSAFPGLKMSSDMLLLINSIGASLDTDLYGSLTGEIY